MFRLSPELDRAGLARAFAAHGRVQIAGLIADDGAERLFQQLGARGDWAQVINSGDKVFDLARETRAGMSPAQIQALDDAVFAGARSGFQYRYEAIRVPDGAAEREASADPLAQFALWLSEGEARDLLREVTGTDAIDFADAQATAFAPGDLLTAHDDDVAGKNRHAAYVFGLTPQWRTEWGGLLLFHGANGDVEHGLLPRFNTLNLFKIPRLHSVSMVTRAAAYRRYSITGWLRSA